MAHSYKSRVTLPLNVVSLWDCFGYEIAVTQFRFLKGLNVRVFCGDGQERSGDYVHRGLVWRRLPGDTGSA
jgi:hypothetical protein